MVLLDLVSFIIDIFGQDQMRWVARCSLTVFDYFTFELYPFYKIKILYSRAGTVSKLLRGRYKYWGGERPKMTQIFTIFGLISGKIGKILEILGGRSPLLPLQLYRPCLIIVSPSSNKFRFDISDLYKITESL